MRFANHSARPNIEPKVMFVNGEHRIGMYALDDVAAQSELFFNYGYDTEIKSEHLHKQAIRAEWMQNSSMANRVSRHMGRTMLGAADETSGDGDSDGGDDDTAADPIEKKKKKVRPCRVRLFVGT